jgi:hypothetical protein
MSVPTVPNRSLQHFGTRSSCRSRSSPPLKRGNIGNADPAKDRKASDLVPSPSPSTPSGTQWVQVVQRGANVVANVVPMRSRCGRGAVAVRGLAFSLPKKSGGNADG